MDILGEFQRFSRKPVRHGLISIDSPVARALLGKSPGDEVDLRVGERREALTIDRIRYQ